MSMFYVDYDAYNRHADHFAFADLDADPARDYINAGGG